MNAIIGKKQIILAALVLGLGVAVYLNYQYSSPVEPASNTDTESNYGDAKFVDKPEGTGVAAEDVDATEEDEKADGEAYFTSAKMTRQKTRDEAVESLKIMLNDVEIPQEQKAELALEASVLAKSIEVEGKLENLIKAKKFTDVMVYYDSQRVDVVVATSGLLENEVSQIKDIIIKETKIDNDKISIVEVKK